jgi:hypothetical protein
VLSPRARHLMKRIKCSAHVQGWSDGPRPTCPGATVVPAHAGVVRAGTIAVTRSAPYMRVPATIKAHASSRRPRSQGCLSTNYLTRLPGRRLRSGGPRPVLDVRGEGNQAVRQYRDSRGGAAGRSPGHRAVTWNHCKTELTMDWTRGPAHRDVPAQAEHRGPAHRGPAVRGQPSQGGSIGLIGGCCAPARPPRPPENGGWPVMALCLDPSHDQSSSPADCVAMSV